MEITVTNINDYYVEGLIGEQPFYITAYGVPSEQFSFQVMSKYDLITLREYMAIYLRMCNDVEVLSIDGAVKKWEARLEEY